MSQPPDAASRRNARSGWPVRTHRLQDVEADDLSLGTTPEERLSMMWPLAVDAWEMAGWPMPIYGRADAPVLVRPLTTRSRKQ